MNQASDRGSDENVSVQETSNLEKAQDHHENPELTKLQTFVIVISICVSASAFPNTI